MLLTIFCTLTTSTPSIYDRYITQARSIVSRMTLPQKLGQMIQADFALVTEDGKTQPEIAQNYFLGSLLIGGDGVPDADGNLINVDIPYYQQIKAYYNATKENWQALTKKFKPGVVMQLEDGSKITVGYLLGTDAVHGDQHVLGNILWPHNLGLSITQDPAVFEDLGKFTATSVLDSGFNFAFAPTVAVTHNPQWGRTYESMGSWTDKIAEYGEAYVRGLQKIENNQIKGVLASVKHFIGDGATHFGADEGNAWVYNTTTFLNRNAQGFKGAIKSDVGNVMCSYSAVNAIQNAIDNSRLQGLLRDEMGFKGFVISDYDQIGRVADNTLPMSNFKVGSRAIATIQILLAGVDMFMLPGFRKDEIKDVLEALNRGLSQNMIDIDRINLAVTRILTVKLAMGLITNSTSSTPTPSSKRSNLREMHLQGKSSSYQEYKKVLSAAERSLVLLKNEGDLLPLKNKFKNVVLVGQKILRIGEQVELHMNYHNMGAMNGGWTVRWQGFEGNYFWSGNNGKTAYATTLLEQLTNQSGFNLIRPNYTSQSDLPLIQAQRESYKKAIKDMALNKHDTVIIGVMSESPYAEMVGDINIPYCQGSDHTGCMWFRNDYSPDQQPSTLQIDYDDFSKEVISILKEKDDIPMVSILLSGRPRLIQSPLTSSQSFIAAFWPGTAGGAAIKNALTGLYPFNKKNTSNRLSFDWPANMQTLSKFPIYWANGTQPRIQERLFERGYGLST